MVKRKFVSTRTLQPGMKIDQAILDKTGRELIAKGAYLDDFQIGRAEIIAPLGDAVCLIYNKVGNFHLGDSLSEGRS